MNEDQTTALFNLLGMIRDMLIVLLADDRFVDGDIEADAKQRLRNEGVLTT